MTCVNAVTFFESVDFYEMVEEMFDNQKVDFKTFVARKLELTGDDEHMDAFRMIRELNEGTANPYDVFDNLQKKKIKPF